MNVLGDLRVRLVRCLGLGWVLVLASLVGALAFVALAGDAAIDLPESLRVFTPWLIGICAAAVIAIAVLQFRRTTSARVARLFERADPELGSALTNAVQLGALTTDLAVQEFLRREAVQRGERAAARLSSWPLARRSVRRALALTGIVAGAWIIFLLLGGDLARVVWPRFTDPRGDHPPYSRVHIDVMPGRAEVIYGGQVEIRATAKGPPVDKLWLVARSGTNVSRTVMFLAPDRSFFQTLSNLREPAQYFVTDGGARSRRFPIALRYTPQITLVEVKSEFPAYTGKAMQTGKLKEEAQALPADTRVSFRIASNRPLDSGELALTPVLGGAPRRIRLQTETNRNIVAGSFQLTEPVAFTISVRDIGGLICAEPQHGRFNILPDERPRLFVLEPGRDAVATPSIRVPVRLQAQDDYGVSRVVWLRGHNRSIERPLNMKFAVKNGPQSVEAASGFELDKLGVRPGDVIEYYFEAADNYPRGPNITVSRMYRLEIISTNQYEQILRQAAARKGLFEPYFKLGAYLRRLAERARQLENKALAGGADKDALAKEASDLADDLDKYHTELGKVLENPLMFDVEQAFRTTLVEQHTRSGQANKSLKNALKAGQPNTKQLRELSDALAELTRTEEEDIDEPGRHIASVAHLLARANTFVKLAREQAILAQMLRRFADRTNSLSRVEEMEVQELAHQQRRIEEGLRNLVTSLPELLAKVPADAPYDPLRNDVTAFLAAVTEAKIEADLAEAASKLADANAVAGRPPAQSAAEKMDKLISKCSGLPQNGKQCLRFQPKLQKALGNSLEQILAAMGAGNGQGSGDGYALFNDELALYGPNVELAGGQDRGGTQSSSGQGHQLARVANDPNDPGIPQTEAPGRVRLQPDAKFPLRYRDLVGEYFRAIAESAEGEKR